MCIHKLAVATYDASEVFCDLCPQRWKIEEILKIAENVINAAQQNTKANEVDVCGFDGGEHDWGRTRCNKCHQPRR